MLLDRYRDEVAALEDDMIAGLSGQETAGLRAVLNTCYDNLSLAASPRSVGSTRSRARSKPHPFG